MADDNQLVTLAVLGGAAFAGWKFLYQPWQREQLLQRELAAQTAANIQKGFSPEDASRMAVSGACKAVGMFYRIPPEKSGGVCNALGAFATWTTKESLKATIAVGREIGKGAKAVGKGIGKGAVKTAEGVKFISYTAPKKVTIAGAKALKFASYTAPKKVIKGLGHALHLWGIGDAGPAASGPRRQLAGKRAPGRKRRSLGGISSGRPARRVTGAAFYTRHL